jgi:hypothetical protein
MVAINICNQWCAAICAWLPKVFLVTTHIGGDLSVDVVRSGVS